MGRFLALRAVVVLAKIVALGLATAALLTGILIATRDLALPGPAHAAGGLAGVGIILGGLLAALGLYARAEYIEVQLAIERHTRETATLIRLGADERTRARKRMLDEADLRWE